MGRVWGILDRSAILTLLFLFSFSAFGLKDVGCEGLLDGVYPLGGQVRVMGVESIQKRFSQQLAAYSLGLSVQDQIQRKNTLGFIAVQSERIAGYAVVEKRGAYLQISNIAVAEDYQGQGVGRTLVEKILTVARETPGMEDVRALVLSSDTATRAFLVALGFAEAEVLQRSLQGQTENGHLMKFAITDKSMAPQLQLAPKAEPKRVRVAVAVLPATREMLHRIDPTLENAD